MRGQNAYRLSLRQAAFHILCQAQNHAVAIQCPLMDDLTVIGDADPALGPVQQTNLQRRFQHTDALADDSLGNAQFHGRGSETGLMRDLAKQA